MVTLVFREGSRWSLGTSVEDNLFFVNLVRTMLGKEPLERQYGAGALKRHEQRREREKDVKRELREKP